MDDVVKQNTAIQADEDQGVVQRLPKLIADHLNSRETLDVIYDLEDKFAIGPEKVRVVPFILSSIAFGEIEPLDVVAALKIGLATTDENAKSIAGIIKDKILNPIAGGLLITEGVDIEPIPGPSAKDAKDLPELTKELEPYLARAEQEQNSKGATAGVTKPVSNLEPLVIGPKTQTNQPAKPAGIGMETPGLRMMKDVKSPVLETTKPEPVTPATPKATAAPRPFMLHEEKPLAPTESSALRVDKSFSFDAGQNPVQKTTARPAPAQFGSSFDSMLGQTKPVTPVTAKTPAETPKVVHYTSFKTALDEKGNPKS